MRWLRAWLSRLFAALTGQDRRERELSAEMETHLEMHIEDNLRTGMPPERARREALMKLGGLEQAKEVVRERRGLPLLEILFQDVRFGIRILRKNPGFTCVAILTLALGIGVNSALFSVINAVLFRPLPVLAPNQLVNAYNSSPGEIIDHVPLAYPDYLDFRDNCKSFSGLLGFGPNSLALGHDTESEMITSEGVTTNYFEVLGVHPVLGSSFEPQQDLKRTTYPVVVLSYTAWQRQFNADPAMVGESIRLNGNLLKVIGVAPPDFSGLLRGVAPAMWVPLSMDSILHMGDPLEDRGSQWLFVTGRLRPGVSAAQAQAELKSIAGGLALQYPKSNKDRTVITVATSRVKILPEVDGALYAASFVLLAFVGLILLIACANLAGMLLARASVRKKEIAVRLALGAGRYRLVRQFLTESLLLSLVGGSVGLLLTTVFDRGVSRALQGLRLLLPVQVGLGLTLDLRVFAFTLVAVTAATLLFGLVPALKSARFSVGATLKEESASAGASRSKHRTLKVLVIGQVGVSLLLLICAGLSVRSMRNAFRVDPGFNPKEVATASFYPSYVGLSVPQSAAFYKSLSDRVQALPGVRSVALTERLPLTFVIQETSCAPQGKDSEATEHWQAVDRASVGVGYFRTMQIPILRGREFDERDTTTSPQVVIVNQFLANLFWPGQDAIGKKVHFREGTDYSEVVGIVRDGKYRTLGEQTRPFIYRPVQQQNNSDLTMLARYAGDPRPIFAAMRQSAREIDSKIPVMQLQPLEDKMSVSLLLPQIGAAFFGFLGMLGLVLASVGLYGVIAYTASQRTHEIGIRMALGARPVEILVLVLRQGLMLALAGLAIGLVAALAATRILSILLYGISATDVPTFLGISVFLLSAALAASYLPARRAMRLDPMVALRYE